MHACLSYIHPTTPPPPPPPPPPGNLGQLAESAKTVHYILWCTLIIIAFHENCDHPPLYLGILILLCRSFIIFRNLQFFIIEREFPITVEQCVQLLLPGQLEHARVTDAEQCRSDAARQEDEHHLLQAHPLPQRGSL